MEYQVVIEDFQGPLDLLLHLIKEKEMDLETLELSVIADQYLQYIHAMAFWFTNNKIKHFLTIKWIKRI